jgi:hypothetical protein
MAKRLQAVPVDVSTTSAQPGSSLTGTDQQLSGDRYISWINSLARPWRLLGILSRILAVLCTQHWSHLRTTNPIESTFATLRLRTQRTKGCGSRIATLTMVFKLGIEAQKHWRRLNGSALLSKVVTGVQFIDGEELGQQAA